MTHKSVEAWREVNGSCYNLTDTGYVDDNDISKKEKSLQLLFASVSLCYS